MSNQGDKEVRQVALSVWKNVNANTLSNDKKKEGCFGKLRGHQWAPKGIRNADVV